MANQTITIRCYYTDRMTGRRVFENVESVIESENVCGNGLRAGLARPADGKGAGYDWYEYPDGTLCHARRNA